MQLNTNYDAAVRQYNQSVQQTQSAVASSSTSAASKQDAPKTEAANVDKV